MASLTEVAEVAGVSRATASLVLNRSKGWERISPECASKVETIARQLRYRTNYHMQSVRRNRANVIGFVFDNGRDPRQPRAVGWPWWNCLHDGAEGASRDNGFDLLAIFSDARQTASERVVRVISERRIDAAIAPALLNCELPPDVPLVGIQSDPRLPLAAIRIDDGAGIRLALQHLRGLGHRDLLWFGPEAGATHFHNPGAEREHVFISQAWEMGLRGGSCHLEKPRWDSEELLLADIERTASAYLAAHRRRYTAVVAYSDPYAMGMCRALMRSGVRVPQDVSVIGFDDLQAYLGFPPLTTIDHRLYDIGYRACEIAIEMAIGKAEAISRLQTLREVIAPRLVVRESTGAVPVPGAVVP